MLDSRKVSYDENHVITSMSRVNFFTVKSPPMLKINSITFSAVFPTQQTHCHDYATIFAF